MFRGSPQHKPLSPPQPSSTGHLVGCKSLATSCSHHQTGPRHDNRAGPGRQRKFVSKVFTRRCDDWPWFRQPVAGTRRPLTLIRARTSRIAAGEPARLRLQFVTVARAMVSSIRCSPSVIWRSRTSFVRIFHLDQAIVTHMWKNVISAEAHHIFKYHLMT